MSKSTDTAPSCKGATTKPAKPYQDFPLFPHATKRWAKKIRGKLYYFGPWSDPDGALRKFLATKDHIWANGRMPAAVPEGDTSAGVTVRAVVNRFLTAKQNLVDSGEISQRTWDDYYTVCERVVRVFGKTRNATTLTPEDFEQLRKDFAKTRGPVSLCNDVTRVRVLFKYAYENGILSAPARYGSSFNKPTKKVLRIARAEKGLRLFEASQIRAMIDKARVPLKAMLLLGINGALGNQDCAKLPLSAVKLDKKLIIFPRPKTGVERRIPLWDETVKALKEAIDARPTPKLDEHAGLLFITSRKGSWAKTKADNPITKEMVKLLKELGMHRPGLSFYALRHSFATVASDSRDQVAVDAIMGHAPKADDMAAVYREGAVKDERLLAVVNFVHDWLFTKEPEKSNEPPKDALTQ